MQHDYLRILNQSYKHCQVSSVRKVQERYIRDPQNPRVPGSIIIVGTILLKLFCKQYKNDNIANIQTIGKRLTPHLACAMPGETRNDPTASVCPCCTTFSRNPLNVSQATGVIVTVNITHIYCTLFYCIVLIGSARNTNYPLSLYPELCSFL